MEDEDEWKYLVVDLKTTNGLEVCTVSERWCIGSVVLYPPYTGKKLDSALRSHETPSSTYDEYDYVKRKVCGKKRYTRFQNGILTTSFE